MSINAALEGLVAGATGVAAMTVAEKIEQGFTGRPDPYVPSHTLERLLGNPTTRRRTARHELGDALGPRHSARCYPRFDGRSRRSRPHRVLSPPNLRLLNDQTLENATGVGALPWTWPADEQAIDQMGKGVYAFVTGPVADRLIAGPGPAPAQPWS